jgi:cysteine desulfurase
MMSHNRIVYLDNNATTRVAPEVIDALLPYLREHWGNPSSIYRFGHELNRRIEEARAQVAALIHADPRDLLFTSCGTESNNTALHAALATQPDKRHLVTTAVEHSAILKHCQFLRKQGYEVTFLPVESDGSLDIHLLDQSIRPDTALVSVMWANNETGIVFPIEEIAALCRSRGTLFHTDAVQAAGKLPVDVQATGVDFLSLSAHKLHAPKGIGALYIKRRTRFVPLLFGGSQEQGRRAGTENVPYIIAFGRAAELARAALREENTRVRALRDRLETGILSRIARTSRNGAAEPRLPNTSNIAFEGVEAEAVLRLLDQAGICASSGSACTTGSLDPSHVLTAMGLSADKARSCIRFSLGRDNTEADVDYTLEQLPPIIARLRAAPARATAPAPAPSLAV